MISCPNCRARFDPEAHPALETLDPAASTAESYAGLDTKCPACGHEFASH
jgi:DNA-directed RNA polymerase subunit RPC12/RpoP